MNQLISFKEFRQRISIIDLAVANGYTLDKKKGRKWPVFKNAALNDTIIVINPTNSSNQGYFNPHNDKDKGTLYNFILNRLGAVFAKTQDSEIKNINHVLYAWLKMDQPVKEEMNFTVKKTHFTVPSLEPLLSTEYLRGRFLTTEIIFSSEFKNRVFNQVSGSYINTCFPYYNAASEIVACEIRNNGYKMQSAGSERSTGIWHSNTPAITGQIILTESPIDAISYHQFKGKENSLYVSFGGSIAPGQTTTLKTIIQKLVKRADFRIISGFDNDRQGEKYHIDMLEVFPGLIKDQPFGKDYNEDLSNSLKRNVGIHL